jgi:hypothetical protein
MYQLFRDRPWVVLLIVAANIALSVWAIRLDPVINNDGVTFLGLAQWILAGNWQAAFDYYNWPFYSIFIAAVASITSLSIEHSAHLLNSLFIISLSWAFVSIVAELSDNNRRIIVIAIIVILFFPSITKYRAFIIRDFAYLSCYLWSLYFLIRFCRTPNKLLFGLWLVFAVLSCLFRFEGIAFILLAPYFLLLFTTPKMASQRGKLALVSVGLLSVSLGLLYWYINDKYAPMINRAQLQGDQINSFVDLFIANTQEKLGGKDMSVWNYLGVIAQNIGNVCYELFRRMGVFYLLFAIFAYYKKLGLQEQLTRRIWLVYVFANLAMLMVFGLYNTFLASRYTMATALTLLILAPFVIDLILRAFKNIAWWKRLSSGLAIVVLVLVSLEGLDVRTNKHHLRESADWISSNLPPEARIYSNNRVLIHYAEQSSDQKLAHAYNNLQLYYYLNHGILRDFDYMALSYNENSKTEDVYRQTLGFKFGMPVHINSGEKGQHVLVFEIPPRQKPE